jgi:hypothetical protein
LGFVLKKFIPAFAALIIATVLLCLPKQALVNPGGDWFNKYHIDKLIHIIIFAILVYLFCRPIRLKGFLTSIITKAYFLIAILMTIYGVMMEFVQKWWVSGRDFDGWDILADAVGSFIGYLIAKRIIKKIKPPTQEELQNQLVDYAKQFIK